MKIDAGSLSSKRMRRHKNIIIYKYMCALDNFKINNRREIHIIVVVIEALRENMLSNFS